MRYCGRQFSEAEVSWLRELIETEPELSRQELSRRLCERVGWRKPDGRYKEMSCRVALLRMERDGRVRLPAPRKRYGLPANRVRRTRLGEPGGPIRKKAGELKLSLEVVTAEQSALWNELIDRYHYLGYRRLPGAQLRYFVTSPEGRLALLGFSAAAWATAPRDRYIGWDGYLRKKNLRFVVNNCRFLILPWVSSRYLASRILSLSARHLPGDWQKRYKYRPVLLETFVDRDRFTGTSYKAAGWTCVGETQGRGKLDVRHERAVPVKTVWVYPLEEDFRKRLFGGNRCRARNR
jgi:Druantia protein DruA